MADVIANEVLRKYRDLGMEVEGQTCVAGVVMIEKDNKVECVTVGQGTKFIPPELLTDDTAGHRVRDCHAEVLAKRAFKKYLKTHTIPPDTRIALYCSSAPCGNSCVKKWAKNSKSNIDSHPHPVFNVSARPAGQVAATVKGEHPLNDTLLNPPVDGLRSWKPLSTMSVPVGTTPAESLINTAGGYIASCSDKIATWCVVGMQGNTDGPFIYPDIVVVGRKFGDATLRRALCCRLAIPSFRSNVKHPLIYRTSVQLDTSVYEESKGAVFASTTCGWWSKGMELPEQLNGSTGMTLSETPSLLCPLRVNGAGGKKRHEKYDRLKAVLYGDKKLLHGYPWKGGLACAGETGGKRKRDTE
eukprot:TRINITY_DN1154_c0_g3_i1.p1 TRINITY_DN1154_c0_g3~~TRINITY_DN1154_c0_g3_i1.p1  ORF type:complete len:357 (+),score=42.96 TRINITY_DN1154_c0_g3_i1:399-1469(+)